MDHDERAAHRARTEQAVGAILDGAPHPLNLDMTFPEVRALLQQAVHHPARVAAMLPTVDPDALFRDRSTVRAVAALADGRTVEEAARLAGGSAGAFLRWTALFPPPDPCDVSALFEAIVAARQRG